MFELAAGQVSQVRQRMVEHFVRDRRLDVGGLRLDAFVADGREITQLVGHAAALAAHAEAARLAGIV